MAALFLTAAFFEAIPARADRLFDSGGSCDLLGCSGIATDVLPLARLAHGGLTRLLRAPTRSSTSAEFAMAGARNGDRRSNPRRLL